MVKLRDPYVLLALASVFGFPVLAATMEFVSPGNNTASVVFRSLVLIDAILVILIALFYPPKSSRMNGDIALFLFFWAIYTVRIVNDTLISDMTLGRPVWFYWLWAFGICFLPSLALILPRKWLSFDALGVLSLYLGIMCCALILAKGNFNFTTSSGDVVDGGRLNVAALNPIFVGHVGASSCLLGGWMFVKGHLRRSGFFSRAISLLAMVVGAVVLVRSDSRGPLVALAVAFLFYIASLRISKSYIVVILSLATAIFVLQLGVVNDRVLDSIGLDRVTASFSDELDISARQRQVSFFSAFGEFLDSPIFGNSLEEQTTLFYPHNVVVEALMATGIVGGLPFIVLLVRVLLQARKMFRYEDANGWVGLIFIQYLVGAQFSGSLYTSYTMWAALSMTSLLYQQRWPLILQRGAILPNSRGASPKAQSLAGSSVSRDMRPRVTA